MKKILILFAFCTLLSFRVDAQIKTAVPINIELPKEIPDAISLDVERIVKKIIAAERDTSHAIISYDANAIYVTVYMTQPDSVVIYIYAKEKVGQGFKVGQQIGYHKSYIPNKGLYNRDVPRSSALYFFRIVIGENYDYVFLIR